MPKKSQDFVFIYGKNRIQWEKTLYDKHRIDAKMWSKELGGSGPDSIDFEDIRKNANYYECPKSA